MSTSYFRADLLNLFPTRQLFFVFRVLKASA